MKTMIRRILPLGLLLVFAVYGYSQNSSTATASKETKSANCATSCSKFVDKNGDGICDIKKDCPDCKGKANCAGKEMKDCKKSCSGGHGKSGCGTTGAGCGKGEAKTGGCPGKAATGQQAPDKTTTPTK